MTIPYIIQFDRIPWETPMAGVRHKFLDFDGRRVRLVEYAAAMPPHWCERGHCGYMLNGTVAIEYAHGEITYHAGDGILIPDGPAHKHRATILSDTALVFFIEHA